MAWLTELKRWFHPTNERRQSRTLQTTPGRASASVHLKPGDAVSVMPGLKARCDDSARMQVLYCDDDALVDVWVRDGAKVQGMPALNHEKAQLHAQPRCVVYSGVGAMTGFEETQDWAQAWMIQASGMLGVGSDDVLPVFYGEMTRLRPLSTWLTPLTHLQAGMLPAWQCVPMVWGQTTGHMGALLSPYHEWGSAWVWVTDVMLTPEQSRQVHKVLLDRLDVARHLEGLQTAFDQSVLISTQRVRSADPVSMVCTGLGLLAQSWLTHAHDSQAWVFRGLDQAPYADQLALNLSLRWPAMQACVSWEQWQKAWQAYLYEVPWSDDSAKSFRLYAGDVLCFSQGAWTPEGQKLWHENKPACYTLDWGRGPYEYRCWF